MEKTRLLVIDDNKELVNMIKEYFKSHADIEVALEAYDGVEGLNLREKKSMVYSFHTVTLVQNLNVPDLQKN